MFQDRFSQTCLLIFAIFLVSTGVYIWKQKKDQEIQRHYIEQMRARQQQQQQRLRQQNAPQQMPAGYPSEMLTQQTSMPPPGGMGGMGAEAGAGAGMGMGGYADMGPGRRTLHDEPPPYAKPNPPSYAQGQGQSSVSGYASQPSRGLLSGGAQGLLAASVGPGGGGVSL